MDLAVALAGWRQSQPGAPPGRNSGAAAGRSRGLRGRSLMSLGCQTQGPVQEASGMEAKGSALLRAV